MEREHSSAPSYSFLAMFSNTGDYEILHLSYQNTFSKNLFGIRDNDETILDPN